ncbi:hypothetical protein GCM10010341_91040 [Streptomyces noursei]|nr:hypothetical protein GCM10010341_91040 [Streptomyces noursei]
MTEEEFGCSGSGELFETFLQSASHSLVVDSHQFDELSLTVEGTVHAPVGPDGEMTPCEASVEFMADAAGSIVVGLVVTVVAPSWNVVTPYLSCDLGVFQAGACGFAGPLLVLSAVPDVSGTGDVVCVASAGLSFAAGGGKKAALLASSPDKETEPWHLSGKYQPGRLPLASMDTVLALPFMQDVLAAELTLPEELASRLTSLSLTQVSADYVPSAGFASWSQVRVCEETAWTVIDGLVELRDITVQYTVSQVRFGSADTPPQRWVTAEVDVTCAVSGNDMTAAIGVPDMILHGVLASPAASKELVGDHLDGSGLDPSTLEINYLYLSCDLSDPSAVTYLLALGLPLDWSIADGVTLTGLTLELQGEGAQRPQANMTATLALGNATASVTVTDTGPPAGWMLTAQAWDIELTQFATWVQQTLGTELPATTTDLTLSNVCLTYLPAQRAFTFTCAGHLLLGETDTSFELHAAILRSDGKTSAHFDGTTALSIPPPDDAGEWQWITFVVTFDANIASTTFTATWTDDTGMPLANIVRAFGLTLPPDIPPNLLPTMTALDISYTTTNQELVLSASLTEAGIPLTIVLASIQTAPDSTAYALHLAAAISAGLRSLPLVADLIPADHDLSFTALGFVTATQDIDAHHLTQLNQAITQASTASHHALPPFPATDTTGKLAHGTTLTIDYTIPGVTTKPLLLPLIT